MCIPLALARVGKREFARPSIGAVMSTPVQSPVSASMRDHFANLSTPARALAVRVQSDQQTVAAIGCYGKSLADASRVVCDRPDLRFASDDPFLEQTNERRGDAND